MGFTYVECFFWVVSAWSKKTSHQLVRIKPVIIGYSLWMDWAYRPDRYSALDVHFSGVLLDSAEPLFYEFGVLLVLSAPFLMKLPTAASQCFKLQSHSIKNGGVWAWLRHASVQRFGDTPIGMHPLVAFLQCASPLCIIYWYDAKWHPIFLVSSWYFVSKCTIRECRHSSNISFISNKHITANGSSHRYFYSLLVNEKRKANHQVDGR